MRDGLLLLGLTHGAIEVRRIEPEVELGQGRTLFRAACSVTEWVLVRKQWWENKSFCCSDSKALPGK